MVWGVLFVLWFLLLLIIMNIFFIGLLGYVVFLRFFICSVVMLFYYVFVGVYVIYDVVYCVEKEIRIEEEKRESNEGIL